jgi:hypothetical protein
MSKRDLKGTNQSLMETMLNGIKRGLKGITKEETSIKGVARMEDIGALLLEDLPGSLPKEEALTIKDPLHLLPRQVALKLKVPRSRR